MAKILLYYAHPGHQYSRVNKLLARIAMQQELTFVDLYEEYPRFEIDIDKEQQRLLDHDVIIFQHPLFWYSTPALLKEWIDLVLEHGFAFGAGGDKLTGKIMMNVISAAGPESAYTPEGYQHYPLRTFLTPLEQTARLCHMKYSAPYVLYSAIAAQAEAEIAGHVKGYQKMLQAMAQDRFDFAKAIAADVLQSEVLDAFLGAQP